MGVVADFLKAKGITKDHPEYNKERAKARNLLIPGFRERENTRKREAYREDPVRFNHYRRSYYARRRQLEREDEIRDPSLHFRRECEGFRCGAHKSFDEGFDAGYSVAKDEAKVLVETLKQVQTNIGFGGSENTEAALIKISEVLAAYTREEK